IEITHLGSGICWYSSRITGAIFCETRPAMIIRSDCRGDGRNTSAPNRAMSKREAPIDIISIAQHANPKVIGQIEFLRIQFTVLSRVVSTTPSGVGLPYVRSLTTLFPFSTETYGPKFRSRSMLSILNQFTPYMPRVGSVSNEVHSTASAPIVKLRKERRVQAWRHLAANFYCRSLRAECWPN